MNSHGKAGGEKAKQHQKLVVSMQPVAAPDADERLRRATELLLQAAANASQPSTSVRKTNNRQASTPSDATEDILAADNAEMNNGKDGNLQNL